MKCIIRSFLIAFFAFTLFSCVQPTNKQIVHFSVDARNELDVSAIGVRGSVPPLNWKSNYELKDDDLDSIYTGTILIEIPYDYMNIKFVKNNDEFELKDQPNRKLIFDKSMTTNYSVSFNQTD